MRIHEMIAAKRNLIATKTAARNALTMDIESFRDLEATDENTAKLAAKRGERDALDAELRGLQDSVTVLEAAEAEERQAQSAAQITIPTGADAAQVRGHVTNEPSVYTAESNQHDNISFFGDAYRFQFKGDSHARERLERHGNEVRAKGLQTERATSTSSFAGLVVPQYLTDQAALIARAGRPTANLMTHLELPDEGMALIIPRATTGVSAAVQSAENTAVSNTDSVMSNITVPVVTIAGQQLISRQALERGTPGIDQILYMDLAAAYAVALDQQVLYGTGSSGQMLGIYNTAGVNQATAFTAAATTTTAYTKIAGQLNAIETLRFLAPDAIVMHPRRWNWLLTQFDSSNRPLVVPNLQGPFNALGSTIEPIDTQLSTPVGTILGVPVITDANVQTAIGTGPEDIIYVMRKEDGLLWENGDGMPRQLDFEQTQGGALTTVLVAYNYAAFTAGRYPAAFGLVGGNAGTAGFGLVAPSF